MMDPSAASPTLLDSALKVAQILALPGAGLWVYLNYFRGRTHVPRLQLDLKAEYTRTDLGDYLTISIAVKNPGLGLVQITQQGTALLISKSRPLNGTAQIFEPNWKHEGAFEALIGVVSIEPGVTFSEQRLLPVAREDGALFSLKLRVVAHERSYRTITTVCPGAKAPGPISKE